MTSKKTANVYNVANFQIVKYGNLVDSDIKAYLSHIIYTTMKLVCTYCRKRNREMIDFKIYLWKWSNLVSLLTCTTYNQSCYFSGGQIVFILDDQMISNC